MTEKKKEYVSNIYKKIVEKRSYSRWVDELNRRETWKETVDRYRNYFLSKGIIKREDEFNIACDMIEDYEILPAMRCLWSAGEALDKENLAGFNCSYTPIDKVKVFADILYILMNGAGVGFSVEKKYTDCLPKIPSILSQSEDIMIFADSKLGWATGFHKFMVELYNGKIVKYDLSKIRPEGARLKTFGGRASGPQPLKQLLEYTKVIFDKRKGSKLQPIDCHDIVCYIANCVVSGGVRRSSCISLSDLNDLDMRFAKNGEFWVQNMQRSLSNNSAVYDSKPNSSSFLQEWLSIVQSRSGERGIFNRKSCKFIVTQSGRRDPNYEFGGNPCLEVILRPRQLCNLSEIVARPNDTKEILLKKAKYATILGCIQSTLTKFNFISREWKRNCEEERLLGVSLTGLRDHKILSKESKESRILLTEMKQTVLETAKEWSAQLGINMPAATTVIKPSGTVSQVVDSASGLHPRYAQYYIRRIRISKTDAVAKLLIDKGVNYEIETGQEIDTANTLVFDFPMCSPDTAILKEDVSALDQLNYWLMLQKYWCEGKPSCTIYIKDSEWMEVGAWVYKNWDYVSGIAFLPTDDNVYRLAPYEEIDEEQYNNLIKEFPDGIDLEELSKYELEDSTEGAKELACVGGTCEI